MSQPMITVNGVAVKCPSEFSCILVDNSASDAGRVQDGNDTMYKNRTSQKRRISLAWWATTLEETRVISQAFNPEYITVTYPDAFAGMYLTKEFYVGDRRAVMNAWTANNKLYSKLSFDIIER